MSELGYLSCILPIAVIVALVLAVCGLAGRVNQQQERWEERR